MGRLKRKTVGDYVINGLMLAICFISLYPVWYTLILSFNDAQDAVKGGIYFLPRKLSLESYKQVFQDHTIVTAFIVTILRTVIGTVISVFFIAMVGYSFSK